MTKVAPNRQLPFPRPIRPIFIVLSGPSGAGKDAVIADLRQLDYPLECITTVTTRPPRPNEKNGVDYHFVTMARFQKMMKAGQLLEWAEVYGYWYGVPKKGVQQALDRGKDAVVRIDVQGAATIKKILPQTVLIFLMPPSLAELRTRLQQRQTESPADLARRLQMAEAEIKQLPLFDYIVINRGEEIDQAVADIKAIITAEKCRVARREISL